MKRRFFSSLGFKASVFVWSIVILTASAIGSFSYFNYLEDSIRSQASSAENVAKSIAGTIDGEQLLEISQALQKNAYWNDVKIYLDKVKTDTDVMYIYVLFENKNKAPGESNLMYFAEGGKPGESPENLGDLGEKDVEDAFAAEAEDCLYNNKATGTGIYYSDGYGNMVSGFAPIPGAGNTTVGVVGVDIGVEDVLVHTREFGRKIIFTTLGFSALFIFLSMLLVNHVIIKPIKIISKASRKIADGDTGLEIKVTSRNELGILAQDFMRVSGTLTRLTHELQENAKAQNMGDIDASIDSGQFSGIFKSVADEINAMTAEHNKEITEILEVVKSFGDGDFEKPLRKLPGKKESANISIESLRENLKKVSGEITTLVSYAKSGELSQRIDENNFSGDWLRLAVELNTLLEVIIEPIQEASAVLQELALGNLDERVAGEYQGDFAIIKNSLNKMASEISSYISEIKQTLAYVAENKLDCAITGEYVGQFSDIKTSINNIIDHLNKIIGSMLGSIDAAAGQVSEIASALASTSQMIASGTTNEASAINELTEEISRIKSQTKINAENASSASEISAYSKQHADAGTDAMGSLLNAMGEISKTSMNISEANKVIEDISFQTNILALNASIEAARSGQYGKGFAVVADEVRNLATKSQLSVKDTTDLVGESISKVNEGMSISNATYDVFGKIVSDVSAISKLIENIAASSKLQEASIVEIGSRLDIVSESSIQNSAASQEMSAVAEELQAQSEELNQMIRQFSFKTKKS